MFFEDIETWDKEAYLKVLDEGLDPVLVRPRRAGRKAKRRVPVVAFDLVLKVVSCRCKCAFRSLAFARVWR